MLLYLALTLRSLGYPDQGFTAAGRTFALGPVQPRSLNMALGLQTMAYWHFERGEMAKSLETAEALMALCREQGFLTFLAHSMILRANALSWLDSPANAIPLLKEGIAARVARGTRINYAPFAAMLVSAYLRAGEIEAGLAITEGFDYPILRDARALLDELSNPQ